MTDANPRDLTDKCLEVAIVACGASQWRSDREFAWACSAELDRRMDLARGKAEVPKIMGIANLLMTGMGRRGVRT